VSLTRYWESRGKWL